MMLIPLLLAQAAPEPSPYVALEACAAQYARQFAARSRETAPVIVDAAIGACSKEEIAFAKTVFDAFPLDRQGTLNAQTTFEFRLARLQRRLAAVVLDERFKRGM